jgi:hypothetical protein
MTDYLVRQEDKMFDSLRQSAKVNLRTEAFLRYIHVEKQCRTESPENAYDALYGWIWDEIEAQSLKEYPLEDE